MSDFEAVVRWYLVLAAAAAGGLPIGIFLFGNAWRRAPWFSRPIGMLALFFPTWYLSGISSFPFTTIGLWIFAAAIAAVAWFLVVRRISLDRHFLLNLASAEGHPASVMDMSFANQALGAEYIVREGRTLENRVYRVPEAIDREIAALKLQAMGIQIDELSAEQDKYLHSWEG